MAGIGHNSNQLSDEGAAVQLRTFCERLERLNEEKKGILDDMKDVRLEAKAMGFHTPTIMKALRLRAMDKEKRDEMLALEDAYFSSLGLG